MQNFLHRIFIKSLIDFIPLQSACLPLRGRWPGTAGSEGVSHKKRDTPPVS